MGPQLLVLLSYGAVFALYCQEAIDSTVSCIIGSMFTHSSSLRANNRCCISHTTSTGIEQFVALKILEWAYNPTSIQILGMEWAYNPTSIQVLGIFIPCSSRLLYLL
jgi:hypothetical protein